MRASDETSFDTLEDELLPRCSNISTGTELKRVKAQKRPNLDSLAAKTFRNSPQAARAILTFICISVIQAISDISSGEMLCCSRLQHQTQQIKSVMSVKLWASESSDPVSTNVPLHSVTKRGRCPDIGATTGKI